VTDDLATYGLGALPDPPDERDYPVSALYAAEGIEPTAALPVSYAAPGMHPPGTLTDAGRSREWPLARGSADKLGEIRPLLHAALSRRRGSLQHEVENVSREPFVHDRADMPDSLVHP
jgi:hypothetical protein